MRGKNTSTISTRQFHRRSITYKHSTTRTRRRSNPIIYKIPSNSSQNIYFEINQLENQDNELNKFILKPDDVINIYVTGGSTGATSTKLIAVVTDDKIEYMPQDDRQFIS